MFNINGINSVVMLLSVNNTKRDGGVTISYGFPGSNSITSTHIGVYGLETSDASNIGKPYTQDSTQRGDGINMVALPMDYSVELFDLSKLEKNAGD